MKSILRNARTGLASLLAASSLILTGCEPPEPPKTPARDPSNNYQGKENFSLSPGLGQVNVVGANSEVVAAVYPNTLYDVKLECNNDGDPDLVDITIDGNFMGRYKTEDNRFGGGGWYTSQFTDTYRILSTGDTMRLNIRVRATDKWGVWPRKWNVMKAE